MNHSPPLHSCQNQLSWVTRWLQMVLLPLIVLSPSPAVLGCSDTNLEVGVCLHVYLERDFLSLETIVYPKGMHRQYSSRYTHEGLPDGGSLSRGWLEGPELEDYCIRLHDVLECFERVLRTCDTAIAFFRFRHLLHSLDLVHHFLCDVAERRNRFVEFLKTIECAEEARQAHLAHSCHRHNVTTNVWNKILRLEVGTEICDSLNTQRSCLLENRYLDRYCRKQSRVDIYKQVSGLFLSTWCRVPRLPGYSHDLTSISGVPSRASADTVWMGLILTYFLVTHEFSW